MALVSISIPPQAPILDKLSAENIPVAGNGFAGAAYGAAFALGMTFPKRGVSMMKARPYDCESKGLAHTLAVLKTEADGEVSYAAGDGRAISSEGMRLSEPLVGAFRRNCLRIIPRAGPSRMAAAVAAWSSCTG
jgi:hypothetical protein